NRKMAFQVRGGRPPFLAGNRILSFRHLTTVCSRTASAVTTAKSGPLLFLYSTMMKERMKISSLLGALGLVVLSSLGVMAQATQDGAMNPADVDRIIQA